MRESRGKPNPSVFLQKSRCQIHSAIITSDHFRWMSHIYGAAGGEATQLSPVAERNAFREMPRIC